MIQININRGCGDIEVAGSLLDIYADTCVLVRAIFDSVRRSQGEQTANALFDEILNVLNDPKYRSPDLTTVQNFIEESLGGDDGGQLLNNQ